MEETSIIGLDMDKISSIRELVNLWPTRGALADDLKAELRSMGITRVSVSTEQVHKWASKGAVPAKFHQALLLASRRRGLDLSAELLAALHSPERDVA